jgi:NADH dehydrogenase FAD-containing subunit
MSNDRPTVVVVGGGYGGIVAAQGLDDVADVVLVEPKDAFVHNVAALRALVDPSWLEQIFLPYDRLLEHGTVVQDRAVEVAPGRVKLASGEEIPADYVVLASGTTYPFPAKSDVDDTADAHAKYRAAYEQLEAAERVALLGVGAVGIELAGEIKAVWPEKHVAIVDPATDVLAPRFSQELRDELRHQLEALGVELVLGSALREPPPGPAGRREPFTVTTEDGVDIAADIWFQCYGSAPVTDYLADELAGALTAGERLEVTPELRVRGHETVFALGDITTADSDGAGVAGRQGDLVAANIRALINGDGPLATYEPLGAVIVVPIGPEGGAGQLPGSDDIAGPETIAAIKGRDMMVDRFAEKFGCVTSSS